MRLADYQALPESGGGSNTVLGTSGILCEGMPEAYGHGGNFEEIDVAIPLGGGIGKRVALRIALEILRGTRV